MYKKTYNKKAQMKIQQMAFMLIAVTLFFVFAGMFIFLIVFSNLKSSAALIEERNALTLVSRLADSPEFACGEVFSGSRINCIDSDKALSLKSNANKYRNFWGIDGVEIIKIYPENNAECTQNNYPNCGKIEILSTDTGTGVSNFVALCHKEKINGLIQDKCDLARLIVTYGT